MSPIPYGSKNIFDERQTYLVKKYKTHTSPPFFLTVSLLRVIKRSKLRRWKGHHKFDTLKGQYGILTLV